MEIPKILVAYKESTWEKDLTLLYKILKYNLCNKQVNVADGKKCTFALLANCYQIYFFNINVRDK